MGASSAADAILGLGWRIALLHRNNGGMVSLVAEGWVLAPRHILMRVRGCALVEARKVRRAHFIQRVHLGHLRDEELLPVSLPLPLKLILHTAIILALRTASPNLSAYFFASKMVV